MFLDSHVSVFGLFLWIRDCDSIFFGVSVLGGGDRFLCGHFDSSFAEGSFVHYLKPHPPAPLAN